MSGFDLADADEHSVRILMISSARPSLLRPTATTENPSAAKRQEIALPMPLVAPTTTARLGVFMLIL